MPPCRLCHTEARLRSSHVVPGLLFRTAHDESRRALQLIADDGRRRYMEQAHLEPLLCEACERRLETLETYFAEAWYDAGIRPTSVSAEVVTVSGLDYDRFKRFHLSILWRLGVSTLPQFRNVRLGSYEDRIRRRLLADDPGPPAEIPFRGTLIYVPPTGTVVEGFLLEPETSRERGYTIYTLAFGGCLWSYFVTDRWPGDLVPAPFDHAGTLTMETRSLFEHKALADAYGTYFRDRPRPRA